MRRLIIVSLIAIIAGQLFVEDIQAYLDRTISTEELTANTGIFCEDPVAAVYFDFEACEATLGSTNMDYSEFVPQISDEVECADVELIGGFLYRNFPEVNTHSCTPGVEDGIAMCIDTWDSCDYDPGNDKSLRFDIQINPINGLPIEIGGLSFYEQSPEMYVWNDGPTGLNNYPTLYAVRVLKDGTEIFRQTDIATELTWNLELISFVGLSDFTTNVPALYSFEFLPYCLVDNGSDISIWDVDELRVVTCCGNCDAEAGEISTTDPTELCLSDDQDDIVSVESTDGTGNTDIFVVTDLDGIILDITSETEFSFSTTGTCLIYQLSYSGLLLGLELGENIANLDGCYGLSAPLTINRYEVFPASISTEDPTVICAGDASVDTIRIVLTDFTATNGSFIITNGDGFITEITNSDELIFDLPEDSSCQIWHISYEGTLLGLELDQNIADLIGCFELSNAIEVQKNGLTGDGDFSISIDDCAADDLSVTLTDQTGILNPDEEPVSWAWTISNSNGDEFQFMGPVVNAMIPNVATEISLLVTLDNGCDILIIKEYAPDMLPDALVEGFLADCQGDAYLVFLISMLDSDIMASDVSEINWIVNTSTGIIELQGDSVSVEISDPTDLSAQVSYIFENGCVVVSESFIDFEPLTPILEIEPLLLSCTLSDFLVSFSNNVVDGEMFEIISYDWTIIKNGITSSFDTPIVEQNYNEGDTLTVISEIQLSSDCVLTDTLIFDPSLVVPELEIITTLLDCNGGTTYEISLGGVENLPPGFVITDKDWTVTVDNISQAFSVDPFTIDVEADQDVLIFVGIDFSNGCTIDLFEHFNTSDIYPSPTFEISTSTCEAVDSMFNVSFTNTTVIGGTDIDSVGWEITIDGTTLFFDTEVVTLDIPEGAEVLIHLFVQLTNGCSAELTELIEAFGSYNDIDFDLTINGCVADAVDVTLTPQIMGLQNIAVSSYEWLIQNGNNNFQFDMEIVNVFLQDVPSTISLTVEFDNGCTVTIEKEFENGILPELVIDGFAAKCSEDGFIVQYSASLPDSITDIELLEINWTITTVDGDLNFMGDTIVFEVADIQDIAAIAVASTNIGCELSGETEGNISIFIPSLTIDYAIDSCEPDGFNLTLSNLISFNGDLEPQSYDWLVVVNGDSSLYDTETVMISLNAADSIAVFSTVDLGLSCVISAEEMILANELLPELGILAEVLNCDDTESTVSISLDGLSDLPPGFVVESENWTVTINGIVSNFTSSPFQVVVDADQSLLIDVDIVFDNGCMISAMQLYEVGAFTADASFEYSLSDCNSINGEYELLLTNTSMLTGATITQLDWEIDVDGNVQNLSGDNVSITVMEGSNISISLSVLYSNGCSATVTENIDSFNPIPEINFSIDVIACVDDSIEFQLIPLIDSTGQVTTVVNYSWTVSQGGVVVFTSSEESPSLTIQNGETLIELSIEFDNNCISNYSESYPDGILPALDISGISFACGENFFVQFIASIPDSIAGMTLVDVQWNINTAEGELLLEGDTISFNTMDPGQIDGTVVATTDNMCILNGDLDIDLVEMEPELEIAYELGDCAVDNYFLDLYNIIVPDMSFDPTAFDWIINIGGVETTYNTDSISVLVNPGDTILAISEVELAAGCSITDTLEIYADDVLPSSDIQVVLVSCLNSFTIEVEVSSIDSFPEGYIEESELWIVNNNGVETVFDSDPFNIQLLLSATVSITHVINFTNGCTLVVTEELDPSLFIPEATFAVEGLNCDADSADIELLFYNTTVLDTFEVINVAWNIIFNGEVVVTSGDSIMVTIPTGTLVSVAQMVTFSNGCVANGFSTMTIEKPSIEFTGDPVYACSGEDVFLVANPNPDWTYTWMPSDGLIFPMGDTSNPIVNVDSNTSFIVTVDNDICDITDTIDVIVANTDTLILAQLDEDCDGLNTLSVLNPDSSLVYEWSLTDDFAIIEDTGISIDVDLVDTTYYVQYAVLDSCHFGYGEIFVEDSELSFLAPNPMMFCAGDTMSYTISNNNLNQELSYLWEDDPHILSALDSNEIIVTIFPNEDEFVLTVNISNQFGCDSIHMIAFMAGDIEPFAFDFDTDCETLTVCFSLTEGMNTILWDFGDPNSDIDTSSLVNPCYTYPEVGDYTVTIVSTDISCIPEPLVQQISVIDTFAIEIGADTNVIFETKELELFVIDAQPGYEYDWSTGETTPTITVSPETSTTFSVTVTDADGCTGIDDFFLTVNPIQCNEDGIFVPNAFSPNGDGVNDILYVRSNCLLEVDFVIYNRWGEELFRTTDPLQGWDGTFKNEALAPDVYGYRLMAICATGETYTTQGNVSIIR